MYHDARSTGGNVTLRCDVCIVGSGAGGSVVAAEAAAAGKRVVVLEAGGLFPPERMNQREATMLPRLYWDAAGRTTADRRIRLHQGKGVGGSTLHNLNLCKRIPQAILQEWHLEHQVDLTIEQWESLYQKIAGQIGVVPVPEAQWNRHNRLLSDALHKLGWRGGGVEHNRSGCVGSGYCELGCAYGAKNHAQKVFVSRAVEQGASVLFHLQAVRLLHDGRRAQGVVARVVGDDGEPGASWTIEASQVVLSASATGTPALLLRSDAPDPSGQTGKTLRIHPALVAAGDFADPVRAWEGIPQTVECTEFLRLGSDTGRPGEPTRIWIVPAFGHPMGVATMMPGWGSQHREVMQRYAHLGVLTAMIHDETMGRVEPDGELGVRVDYQPTAADRAELHAGQIRCAQLLFAAGAQRVLLPRPEPLVLTAPDQLATVEPDALLTGATAVHPMGSCRMSQDPQHGVVASNGRHHGLRGLWLADGSLFPTSIGGPPQWSIYALGLHVGRDVAAARS